MALQGMNVNARELEQHVEYESRDCYAAFTYEIEISASTTKFVVHVVAEKSGYPQASDRRRSAVGQSAAVFRGFRGRLLAERYLGKHKRMRKGGSAAMPRRRKPGR